MHVAHYYTEEHVHVAAILQCYQHFHYFKQIISHQMYMDKERLSHVCTTNFYSN